MYDPGFREGYALLGSYRRKGGFGWIYALRGTLDHPQPGSTEGWLVNPVMTMVVMRVAYEPAIVNRFPARTAVAGGQRCAWPDVEARALIAAGLAEEAEAPDPPGAAGAGG